MSPSHLAFSGLMPHPPIVVPEVGRDHAAACRATTEACADFARRLVASAPERLFLVSPHSPRLDGSFGLWAGERLLGGMASFGAPEVEFELPNDDAMRERLRTESEELGLSTWSIPSAPLDHGASVPLAFLSRSGWRGPTSIASLPWDPDTGSLRSFGTAVRRSSDRLPGRIALVASGDMSHRVLEGAPAGYHPRAVEFDRAVCTEIEEGRLEGVSAVPEELRALAAEDVVDTSTLVIGALSAHTNGTEVLSYEHPFGVGYLVAVFHDGTGTP